MKRRDFLAASAALVGSAHWPLAPQLTQHAGATGSVILFQGDSVTDCGRDRAATDANTAGALGSGYPLLVTAAALAAHPDRGLKFYNRGVSGNKVPDLEERWVHDTLELKPDVLSILIGVNDFWHKLSKGYTGTVEDYETQYTALLIETRRALPNVRLIILEPFVLRCCEVNEHWFPEFTARQQAAARVAARADAAFVRLQKVFDQRVRKAPPQYWASDGVHPTAAGHAVIAEQWRKAAHL
jgi:lysophospholipase L1-like esterase